MLQGSSSLILGSIHSQQPACLTCHTCMSHLQRRPVSAWSTSSRVAHHTRLERSRGSACSALDITCEANKITGSEPPKHQPHLEVLERFRQASARSRPQSQVPDSSRSSSSRQAPKRGQPQPGYANIGTKSADQDDAAWGASSSASQSSDTYARQQAASRAYGSTNSDAAPKQRVARYRQQVKLPHWAIQRAAADTASAGVASEDELRQHVLAASKEVHVPRPVPERAPSPTVRQLKHTTHMRRDKSPNSKFAALTAWADLATSRLSATPSDPAPDRTPGSYGQSIQGQRNPRSRPAAKQEVADAARATARQQNAPEGGASTSQRSAAQRDRHAADATASSSPGQPGTPPSQPQASPNIRWRLFGVDVPLANDPGKDDISVHEALCKAVSKRLRCKDKVLGPEAITLVRKSFDARKGKPKKFSYVVDVDVGAAMAAGAATQYAKQGQLEGVEVEPRPARGVAPCSRLAPPVAAAHPRRDPVVVVGSGPAGLFAALTAAEAGLPVVLLERGQPVDVRGRDIGALFVRGKLNPESNLCYGEGGAGTWSDGKLTTRIGRNSDPVRRVLATLFEMGAPEEILVAGKPHLGTDRLVRILKAFRAHLTSLGVDIRFGTRMADLLVTRGRVTGVQLAAGQEISAAVVVLAVGHSSRPVYEALQRQGALLTPKPFAMGFRVEHPQALIDAIQYGQADAAEVQRGKGRLPVADYRLAAGVPALVHSAHSTASAYSATPSMPSAAAASPVSSDTVASEPSMVAEPSGNSTPSTAEPSTRSVFSFCMCPGGQIVPTSTDPEELCVNGMSFSRRNSVWANSALVVGVGASDWAPFIDSFGPLAGMQLQVEAEREAARRGGGCFVAPVQRVTDFMAGETSQGTLPSSSYRLGVKSAPLHDLYSPAITEALRKALLQFERRLPGFLSDVGLLHGVETRTSAPVRVDRDDKLQSTTLQGLYPCGEGAGYAGGIVSAAVDGLRVGEAVVAQLKSVALLE